MTRYTYCRKLGGLQGRSGLVRKISLLSGLDSQDRATRSESLYRLSYPAGLRISVDKWQIFHSLTHPSTLKKEAPGSSQRLRPF